MSNTVVQTENKGSTLIVAESFVSEITIATGSTTEIIYTCDSETHVEIVASDVVIENEPVIVEVIHSTSSITEVSSPTIVFPPESSSTKISKIAAVNLNAYKIITTDSTGKAIYGDSGNLDHKGKILGVSLNSALTGSNINIITFGSITNTGWSFTPEQSLYVGLNGEISTIQVGLFSQYLGYAVTPTEIFIRLGKTIVRAY